MIWKENMANTKYNLAIVNSVQSTGNHMVRRLLTSYDNTYTISWDEEKNNETVDPLVIVTDVIHRNGWSDIPFGKIEKIKGLVFCGLRHPALMINTRSRKRVVAMVTKPIHHDYPDDDEIFNSTIRTTTGFLNHLRIHFENSSDAAIENLVSFPVDTMSYMDPDERVNFIRASLEEKSAVFIEGKLFGDVVQKWEKANSTSHHLNSDLRKDSIEEYDRVIGLMSRINEFVLDSSSTIGSKLYDLLKDDVFTRWYPNGMEEASKLISETYE